MGKKKVQETDTELINIIEEAIESTKTYVEALDKVIKWEKKNRGLVGFHISIYPLKNIDYENAAKEILMMHLSHAKGQYRDVTEEIF